MGVIDDVEAIRRAARVSQEAVAKRAGLSRETISKIETGAVDPQLSTLHEYCRALDLELMVVPKALLTEFRAFVASGGSYLAQPPGVDAPPSIVDVISGRR